MTDASLAELLSTKMTARAVTQVAATTSELLNFFGFQGNDSKTDGRNVRRVGHRTVGYDIFNDARTVGSGRAPGTAAGTIRRQAVGRVEVTFPRMYEKLPLLHDELHNFRKIGGPSNEYDEAGKDYIMKQQRYLGQRAANFRLLLIAGMMRGGALYGHVSGDDIYYDFTSSGAAFTVDWKMPAGNKTQLNMTGSGSIIDASWATTSTNIPLHLAQINAGFQYLAGTSLKNIIINSTTWQYIINNTKVQQQAGTSATPFETFKRDVGMGSNGRPLTVQHATLRACPFFDFMITDAVIEVGPLGNTSTVKLVPDGYAWFGPEPDSNICEMLLGSEPVNEGYGKNTSVQYGAYAWTKEVDDPAGVFMYSLDNALPAWYIPNASAWGQISGF
ncbi:Major capsid protein GpE [uncultured Caudovirales phage]|uniref:Major capsid protein GpE n=1 Tax=uncultured Caudovirales phage TaxID=2100421 RepID=A0A6J5RBJ3_9CAUD|nr:Major capsid protein GpE [uncultured Caudovirales phage]